MQEVQAYSQLNARKRGSKKTLVYVLFLIMVTWQRALPEESRPADSHQDAPLRFRLEALDSYIVEAPVPVTFVLENLTHKDVYVLTWYTPLEGLNGKIFKVTRDGAEIPYEGRMIKRGAPVRNDYVHITPLGSASAVVDLAIAYTMQIPGEYHVEFIKYIYDLTFNNNTVSRRQAEHQAIAIAGNSVTLHLIRP